MKGRRSILLSWFFSFTVIILLLRPAIIFSSDTLQSTINIAESSAAGIQNILKKRREIVRIGNIISKENKDVIIADNLSVFFLFANKKWLRKLLFALSLLLSQFIFLIRKRATLFEIVPSNHHYLALSVIRI